MIALAVILMAIGLVCAFLQSGSDPFGPKLPWYIRSGGWLAVFGWVLLTWRVAALI